MRHVRWAVLIAAAGLTGACGSGGSTQPEVRDVFRGWARGAGGLPWDDGTKVATFPDGSVVVAGTCSGLALFGAGTPDPTWVVSAGARDVCLARYAADGTFLWVRQAGGVEDDLAMDVAALADGSFLVTGSFRASAVFGPGEANETIVDATNLLSTFVARYDADGRLIWVRRPVGGPTRVTPGANQGNGIGALADGSAVVTGYFIGSLTFGAGEPEEVTFEEPDAVTPFLARFEADGSLGWARADGPYAMPRGIAVFADGASVVTGYFSQDAVFGAGEPTETTLPAVGAEMLFVARFGADGSFAWARRAGSAGSSRTEGVDAATDADGSVAVSGLFNGDALFGAGTPNTTLLTTAGDFDVCVARYDVAGLLLWAKRAGGLHADQGESVAVHANGTVYVTGFCHEATFGPGEPGRRDVTSAGGADIFVARFEGATGALQGVRLSGGPAFESGLGIAVLDDRSYVVSGKFSGECHFGSGTFQQTLAPVGSMDLFVAHFGPTGEF